MIRPALALAACLAAAAPACARAEARAVPLACAASDLRPAERAPRILILCRGSGEVQLIDERDGRVVRRVESGGLPAAAGRRSNAAIAPDGRRFAVGFRDGTLALWDEGGAPPRVLKRPFYANSLRFAPDGATLLVDGEPVAVSADDRPHVSVAGDFDIPNDLVFTAAGDTLAVAEADTTIRLYDARRWSLLAAYRGLRVEPMAIAFADSDRAVVVGSADGHLLILDRALRPIRDVAGPAGSMVVGVISLPGGSALAAFAPQGGGGAVRAARLDLRTGALRDDPSIGPADAAAVRDGHAWMYRIDGATLRSWSVAP